MRLKTEVLQGRGPYMFFVHGMLSSRLQWAPNAPALQDVVRPVLFDLWGHGASPTPADEALYCVDALAAELEKARIELGAGRIVLCGQSFGACTTLRYCVRYPERVIAHVFTNSLSALSDPSSPERARMRAARRDVVAAGGREALRELPFHPRHARKLDPETRRTLEEMADRVDPAAFVRYLDQPSGSTTPDELRGMRMPTLLVNGLRERRFQPLRDLAVREIPGCRVVDLDAGHALNLEQPEAFNEAVHALLRDAL